MSGFGLGLRLHWRRQTSGGGVGVPAPTGTARFLNAGDGSGSAVTAPVIGDVLYIDPGPFSNSPASYDYTIYADGVSYETGTFAGVGDRSFVVDDDLLGKTLQAKCHAINGAGTSASTSDSSVTSAITDIDVSNAITAFTRTSGSGVTPVTFSLTYGANARAGGLLAFRAWADAGQTTLVSSGQKILADADLAPGATIDLAAMGVTYTGTSYLEVFYQRTSPGGVPHVFFYTPMLAITDPAVYSKYRLSITKDASEFWTGVASLEIASVAGGADLANSVDNAGVTYFGDATPSLAFDKNNSTAWEYGFSGEAYPHIVGADFSGATPFAAKEYRIRTDSGGQPKTWKFQGWNGSAWVDLDTKAEQFLSASSTYPYGL